MGESNNHIHLVEELVYWISRTYLSGDKGYLLIDHPESAACSKPPRINGYVPDVFTASAPHRQTIIGEAKTTHDVERPHSVEQIKAFLRYCLSHENAVFVFAVPWPMSRYAKTLLKRLQQQTDASMVKIIVIEGLSG
jgi:hypothetical protein